MSFFLNRKKLNKKKEKWQLEKELLQEQIELKKQKLKFFELNKIIKKQTSTTKRIILFLFINCSLIEIFTGVITIINLHLAATTGAMIDFTPIVTLIGAVVSEVIGFAIYAVKATKQNTRNGIVFEQMMNKYNMESNSTTDQTNMMG